MPKATRTHTTPTPSAEDAAAAFATARKQAAAASDAAGAFLAEQDRLAGAAGLKQQARRQRYTIPNHVTGDALLIALAAAFRQADEAGAAFEDAGVSEAGIMERHIAGAAEAHYRRRDVIEQALCCIPATDLAGAMIQVEAIARLSFRGPEHDLSHAEDLRDFACWSIFNVLALATGRTAADGLALEMVEARDRFAADVAGKRAALTAYFDANGLGGAAAAQPAQARARSAGAAGRAEA